MRVVSVLRWIREEPKRKQGARLTNNSEDSAYPSNHRQSHKGQFRNQDCPTRKTSRDSGVDESEAQRGDCS
ncbi:hypothetical protein DICVIV_05338 [Dictyocaulus viviparus]|uniref:Uncharacterized protein n=1 Tax=Dictyocaulus viviparus TaxID=29172 RepID=A0A0D8XXI5_DICVI|nr:hypothetical protein DICVIV_05338 [Dictyocaulus viviparus]